MEIGILKLITVFFWMALFMRLRAGSNPAPRHQQNHVLSLIWKIGSLIPAAR